MQDNREKRFVDLDCAVVFDEAHFSELIHEQVHPRSRCTDHFRKGLL